MSVKRVYVCLCVVQGNQLSVVCSSPFTRCLYIHWILWVFVQISHCIVLSIWLTYTLSLPAERRPQTTCLHPALSCPAASIFLQLYLYPAVHISFSISLFQVFLGRHLSLWPCSVHCSTCLVMLHHFFLTCALARSNSFFVFAFVFLCDGPWLRYTE